MVARGLIVAAALFLPGTALGLTPFLTEDVDTGEFLGTYTSIALDGHGNPHISYKDEITIRLKYATKIGESWFIDVVDDPAEAVGSYTSIALDSDEEPVIAYYDGTLNRLKLARRNAGVWTIEVVDDPAQDVGKYASLAIDEDDVLHVAYYDDTLNRLKYAWKSTGTWVIQVVDDPVEDVGQYASLALDNTGRPHIAYFDATTPRVRYAALFGSSWTIITAGGGATLDGHIDLALDASGRAHIIYKDAGAAKYAQNYDYPSWITESIEGCDGTTAIAVDPAGTPRVAFYETLPGAATVHYAIRTGPDQWEVEDVDRAGIVGDYCALALDRQGNARISYFDGGAGHLRYADASLYVREPAGSDTWPVGADRTIRWDGIGPVDVSLSVDGGRTYEPIEQGILDRTLSIRVPHAPTRFARVRITRTSPFATAETDSLFTIDASVVLSLFRALYEPGHGNTLTWSTNPGPEDLAGYRLERAAGAGAWTPLVETHDTTYRDASGTPGSFYRLRSVNGFGQETLLGEARVAPARPLTAAPLPYRGGDLAITFGTSSGFGGLAAPATLGVYDVSGRLVRLIDEGRYESGFQSRVWDGRDGRGRSVVPGTYFLRLTSNGAHATLKVPVLR